MLEELTMEDFARQANTRFRLNVDSPQPIELELLSAEDLGSSPAHEQFSLVFRGPLQVFLPQRIYPLTHERLGALNLFLVPIAQEPDGFRYEAIINRVNEG